MNDVPQTKFGPLTRPDLLKANRNLVARAEAAEAREAALVEALRAWADKWAADDTAEAFDALEVESRKLVANVSPRAEELLAAEANYKAAHDNMLNEIQIANNTAIKLRAAEANLAGEQAISEALLKKADSLEAKLERVRELPEKWLRTWPTLAPAKELAAILGEDTPAEEDA